MLISFNGYRPPANKITKYSVSQNDLDSENSGRSESGYMTRSRIRKGLFKIEFEATALTNSEMHSLLQAISPTSFTVKFDFGGSSLESVKMYVGDRNIEKFVISNAWTVGFSLVQY